MTTARAQDILEWLHRVLREHDKSTAARSGQPVCLPSSLAERERWMPLLTEAFRAAGGTLVDATKCGGGTECGDVETDAPSLVTAVTDLLDAFNALDPTAELNLTIEMGRATVTGATPIASVNAAQRAVREAATAMCDIQLRSSDLTCIAYAEDALDPSAVELVWTAMISLIDHVGPTPETTLCIVAGDSRVNVGIHCRGPRSLRFRIDNEQVQERHPYEVSSRTIRQVTRHSQKDAPLMVVFLGAGASVSDGLPLGDGLRDRALGDLMDVTVDGATFPDVARRWYGQLEAAGQLEAYELAMGVDEFVRTLTLERVLEHEQAVEGTENCTTIRRFAEEHQARFDEIDADRVAGTFDDHPLVRICSKERRLVLVTVNFDRFIEARAGAHVRPYYKPEDLDRFPADLDEYIQHGGPVPLLKLHGDIGTPTTLVATIGETNAGLTDSRQKAILALVSKVEAAPIKPWWYVGYSMRDRDLENIWKGAEFPEFDEHWVSPFLDPNVEEFIGRHRVYRWTAHSYSRNRSAKERLVSLLSDDFWVELADSIDRRWT